MTLAQLIRRWSLRVKLTLGYALVFALTVLLGAVGVYVISKSSLTASLDQTLQETASVAQASILTSSGLPRFAPQLKSTSDLSIELLSASGQVLASVGRFEDTSPPVKLGFLSFAEQRLFTQQLAGGLYLRVSRPSDTLSSLLEILARILLVGSFLMIVLACIAGYWLADRALRPVDAVARTAAAIAGRGDYRERVPVYENQAGGQDELARLVGTVNAMLDRLEGTIEREKQFARIAAHELRTPLTVLKGRLELILERPRDAAAYQKALHGMQSRVDALMELSEQLLALARTDAPVQLEPVELAASVLQATEQLSEVARSAGKRLAVSVTETWVLAERDGVQRLLINLLENALKYGSGDVVTVEVEQDACTITNAGAGPTQADWARLLQPFERGPGLQDLAGTGLGLALVAALTKRWGAELKPRWLPQGFEVQVQFPVTS